MFCLNLIPGKSLSHIDLVSLKKTVKSLVNYQKRQPDMTVEDTANGEFSSALQLCRMVTQWAKRTKLCHAFDIEYLIS